MPFVPVLKRALATAWWIIKIVIPTSLIVSFLDYFGVISMVSVYTEPLFALIGLPGKAAVVYISSVLLPLYVPIAVMGSIGLNLREVSILALMCLLAHNLPVESAVQRRSGLPLWQSVSLRISFSLLGGFLLNLIMPQSVAEQLPYITHNIVEPTSVVGVLQNWFVSTLSLCVKLIVIITLLMLLQDFLKRKGLLSVISKPLAPFMKICGLKPESSFLWLIANIVGLAYGAGIMAQEMENCDSDAGELRNLNRHIALNHSLVEDTLIFAMIGVAWYYLLVPRFLFALIVVWCVKLFSLVKGTFIKSLKK